MPCSDCHISHSRRRFLEGSIWGIGGAMAGIYPADLFAWDNSKNLWKWNHEAYFYRKDGKNVQCETCPNGCYLEPGNRSHCRSKINFNGKLYSLAYGNPCAIHVDPIEKKPLFHFLPTTKAFSIAAAGCNLRCLNCQNWEISQITPEEAQNQDMFPASVVDNCIKTGSQSIAYTYSEPISYYEYLYDTAKTARAKNIKNVLVSNGYINEKPLRELAKYIDAAAINLKSFKDDIYKKLNGASLQPVLRTLKILKEMNVWLEIINLVIPTWTEDFGMIREMSKWLVKNGFSSTPLHFTRFSPLYKLTHLPFTPVESLEKARQIAENEGMKFAYVGNVPGNKWENTFCPNCKKMVLERKGFYILNNNLNKSNCKFCGTKIPGVWV